MGNVNKMYFRLNDYETVAVDPARKPKRGELAAILYNSKVVLNRVISNMKGVSILGKPVQIQRYYNHGTPPITVADISAEKCFYNTLQPFEKLLYRGLIKAEELYTFPEYNRAVTYFLGRLNKTRRRIEQDGIR